MAKKVSKMTDNKGKKKISLWRKLTTEDWMTPRQLKAYVTMILIFGAVIIYLFFISTTQVFSSPIIGVVLSIILYALFAYVTIRYRIKIHRQSKISS